MNVLQAAERRESLVREIRVKLLAPRSSREAEELEQALRDALAAVDSARARRTAKK